MPDTVKTVVGKRTFSKTIKRQYQFDSETINKIRSKWNSGKFTSKQIADMCKVSDDTIRGIIENRTAYDPDYVRFIFKSSITTPFTLGAQLANKHQGGRTKAEIAAY